MKPERADEAFRWLRANGHDLAPLTGQDSRVLLAIDACWRAYTVADDEGSTWTFQAITGLLRAMQPKCWYLAVELVARHMDWTDRDRQREQLRSYTPPGLAGFLSAGGSP